MSSSPKPTVFPDHIWTLAELLTEDIAGQGFSISHLVMARALMRVDLITPVATTKPNPDQISLFS